MVRCIMDREKRNNDPWVPLPNDTQQLSIPQIAPAPQNPLYDLIDSDRYIQSLERKLAQITKRKRQEPTSREIITSLALFHDDQMRRYVADAGVSDLSFEGRSETTDETVSGTSFVQRKLHPERQPLSAEEIVELVREDVMAKTFEELMSEEFETTTELKERVKSTVASSSSSSMDPAEVRVSHATAKADPAQTKKDSESDHNRQPDNTAINPEEDNWANFEEMNDPQVPDTS